MSFAAKLGQKFPTIGSVAQSLSAPNKRSLESVRSDVWRNRLEFWIRRGQNVPNAAKAAQAEACQLWTNKLSNPSAWTYGDVASGVVVGTQLFGCFALGEVLARGSFTGYKQGSHDSHH